MKGVYVCTHLEGIEAILLPVLSVLYFVDAKTLMSYYKVLKREMHGTTIFCVLAVLGF